MGGYVLENAFWLAFPIIQCALGCLLGLVLSAHKGQFLPLPQTITHTIESSTQMNTTFLLYFLIYVTVQSFPIDTLNIAANVYTLEN